MVWPFNKKRNEPEETHEEQPPLQNYSMGKKYLLEDTQPRFSNESQSQAASKHEQATLSNAWKTVTWNDFSFQRLAAIPCFRDAGMTGFTSMFAVGTVMLLYHKNPSRAANWAVGGLMLGSIVGWEQCRLRRRRSFEVAQMAKQTVAGKEKPMLHPVVHDDRVKQEWEEHNSNASRSRPWYKFW
ncbi:LAFE_0H05006g1_1 [Lachancea fermentati]|uniref:Cytochrome c oxidase assembly protein COX20, mitochondrial n=1 Tax=Lachancea fermentati TaxID=4955 RepID=A0A1G4MJY8_LACFM|nr:LAFE_0H05006g1_1 [Lachancea fermentati]